MAGSTAGKAMSVRDEQPGTSSLRSAVDVSDILGQDFVVESVFEYLGIEELFACAEVNRLWQSVALSLLRKKLISVSICCSPESEQPAQDPPLDRLHACVEILCSKFARYRNIARLAGMRPSLVFLSYHADLNEDRRVVDCVRELLPLDSVIVYFKLELIRVADDSDDSTHEGVFGEFLFHAEPAVQPAPTDDDQQQPPPLDSSVPGTEERRAAGRSRKEDSSESVGLQLRNDICLSTRSARVRTGKALWCESPAFACEAFAGFRVGPGTSILNCNRHSPSSSSGPSQAQRRRSGAEPPPVPVAAAPAGGSLPALPAVWPRPRIPSMARGSGAVFRNVLPGVLVFQALHVIEGTLEADVANSRFTEEATGRIVTSVAIFSAMQSSRLDPFMRSLGEGFGPTTDTIAVAFPRNQDEARLELEAFERTFPRVPALANQATEFNVDGQFAPIGRLKLILLLIKLLD
ncbi:hypothetical protein HPB49_001230 [Dermacentor silvarum]|uniref:Uncharacterized protein n=1 Tax=Dermacentor silvarum TaxID=543639 RepID=A0ACB8CJ33_DERSI|nr:hypothetical protein HPB49_001230 [Dermacentor silvarum]